MSHGLSDASRKEEIGEKNIWKGGDGEGEIFEKTFKYYV